MAVDLLNEADLFKAKAVCCTGTKVGALAPAPYTCSIVNIFDQSSFECILEALVLSKS